VGGQPGQWLANREPIARSADSRQFVDRILAELAAGRFGPTAWTTFIARSLVRSVAQARMRPVAATEVTALHLLAGAAGSRRWALVSWSLCITHVGLLGDRSTLGWPNRLTLLRALLPSVAPVSRWTSLIALATDFMDGRLARRGAESAFGAFADPIADGVFWSWYALRWETNRWLRWAPLTLFAASTAAITAAYFVRGRTIDYPRLQAVRYLAGATQFMLALRAMRSVTR
jgi:hypothetical protein